MPITSVYEDGLVFCMEDDVGSTRQLVDLRLEIVSQRRHPATTRTDRSGAVFRRLTAAILRLVSGAASMGHSIHSRDEDAIPSCLPRPTRW